MAKKKVFIAVGHGGSDPGAVANGLKEKDLNLPIALACRDTLVRHDLDVMLSRLKDENDPMSDEIRECNAFNPDVSAAFHINAGGGKGAECWVPHDDALSKVLARHILAELEKLGQNSRGIKTRLLNNGQDYYGYIRGTRKAGRMTTIIEYAFIDNKADIKFIDTEAEQKIVGEATAKAILTALGIKYKKAQAAKYYRVQAGAFLLKKKADSLLSKIKKAGFTAYVTKVGLYYKVQVGAFSKKPNAQNMLNELAKAGFKGFITYS